MRRRNIFAAFVVFAMMAAVVMAAIPAPPVNQNLGIPDTNMVNQSVDLCKACHPGAPDIHHYMVSGGPGSNMIKTTTLGCVDCHPVIGGQLTISKNCHDCHDGTVWAGNPTGIINLSKIRGLPGRPHHNTTKNSASNAAVKAAYVAANRTCVTCHGDGYLDNYNDGHYVPSYNNSMITPLASFKVNDSGKLWGGCLACHDDGTETINGIVTPIYNSDTTHHTARFWIGYQCNNCHVSYGSRAEPNPDYNPEPNAAAYRVNLGQAYPSYTAMFGWDTSKTKFEFRNNTIMTYTNGYAGGIYSGVGDALNGTGCEKCHSVRDLHNIETASPGRDLAQTLADQIPGYGHIGNNSDCNGCHQGWAGSTENPFPGPKAMAIDSVTPGIVTANVATVVTIAGSNFVETPYTAAVLVDGTPVTATVTETSITATLNLAAGAHSIVVQKDVATTAPTSVMAVAPGTITSAKLTGTTLTIDGSGLGAGQTLVVIVKTDGSLVASDSITSSTDTQIVAVASLAAVGDTIEVITPTGKAIATIAAGKVPPVNGITVTSPNGGESWKQKSTQAITWTKVGSMGANVKIEILLGTSVKKTISTANSGTYNWAIGTQAIGTTYKVRITSVNARKETYPIYTDTSDNTFRIVK